MKNVTTSFLISCLLFLGSGLFAQKMSKDLIKITANDITVNGCLIQPGYIVEEIGKTMGSFDHGEESYRVYDRLGLSIQSSSLQLYFVPETLDYYRTPRQGFEGKIVVGSLTITKSTTLKQVRAKLKKWELKDLNGAINNMYKFHLGKVSFIMHYSFVENKLLQISMFFEND